MKNKPLKLPGSQTEWLCPFCQAAGKNTVLGIHCGDTLRIKYKELYVEFEGEGRVATNCRACAARVEAYSQNFQLYQSFKDERLKQKQKDS